MSKLQLCNWGKSCELNTRTKEARPENFQPDDLRFYMGRISGRSMYPV